MKTSYAATIVVALAALTAGQAMAGEYAAENYVAAAATAGKTRDQVRAELTQAKRTGDIVANYETGAKLNELTPGTYPATAVAQGTTREQVRAEFVRAQHNGEIMASFELGPKFN